MPQPTPPFQAIPNDMVHLEGLPSLTEDALASLEPSYGRARGLVFAIGTLGSGMAWLAPMVALTFWGDGGHPPLGVWLGLGAAWAVLMSLWGLEEWKGWPVRGYLVREHDVIYRSGWWSRSWTAVPFSRIQHSEIQQGPLGRWLGYCSLKLFTAGGSGANLEIPGLHPETAKNIRLLLENQNHG